MNLHELLSRHPATSSASVALGQGNWWTQETCNCGAKRQVVEHKWGKSQYTPWSKMPNDFDLREELLEENSLLRGKIALMLVHATNLHRENDTLCGKLSIETLDECYTCKEAFQNASN